jgi:membrane protein required for colicin V production
MTAFDIIVLFLLGYGCHFRLHARLHAGSAVAGRLGIGRCGDTISATRRPTEWLYGPVGTDAGAAVLAFLAIAVVIYVLGRMIARKMGEKSRKSALGPFDRVLGFGFGAVKGLIGATLLFPAAGHAVRGRLWRRQPAARNG